MTPYVKLLGALMIDFKQIIQDVNQQRDLLFQPASCHVDKYLAEFSGNVENVGELIIAFNKHFPTQLPDIFLKDTSISHLHVEKNGKICLTDQSSLLIDTTSPTQLVLDCIDMALRTLRLTPDSPNYKEELKNEFLSYWGMREYGVFYDSILQLQPNEVICQEYPVFLCGEKYLIANSIFDANVFYCNTLGNKEMIENFNAQALVIRLKKGSAVPDPFKKYDWSSVKKYIHNNTDKKTQKLFIEKIKYRVKKYTQNIVLELPNDEGNILFGFIVYFNNNNKMNKMFSSVKLVRQINITRNDYDFLLSRCGSTPSLREKRVLLLGCGSVGGFLANNLCQMGVTQIDLLDSDIFTSENVHRHFMGFDTLQNAEINKADLLKSTLEGKYAYLDVDSLNYEDRTVEAVVLTNPQMLSSYDLVISALGEPTLNLEINRLIIENNINTPFMVCFNEPYGIGGHVITTNLSSESCLRCFYSEIGSGSVVPFLGSLVQPGQNFKRSLSGCSGIFVPYSTLDSQQTAIYAARKAVDVLNGVLTHNDFFYLAWRQLNIGKSRIQAISILL